MARDDASMDMEMLEAERLPPGIFLLFEKGRRPRKLEILAAIDAIDAASVSFDPSRTEQSCRSEDKTLSHSGEWVELLQWGMTFDLLGMAPGPSVSTPDIAYRFGCAFDPADAQGEAIALVPGPHLVDGSHSLPIVRAMLDLASEIAARLEGVQAVCWSPARSAMAPEIFTRAVEGWLAGGAFPALGMTGFAVNETGEMVSEGLDHFIGQELSLDAELASDPVAATRLGARLVHELVGSGKLEKPREFVTQEGLSFRLSPDESGTIIRVSPM